MKIKQLIFMCMLCLSVQSKNGQASLPKEKPLGKDGIDQLLKAADSIRTNDYLEFKNNLNTLSQYEADFSQAQSCLYKFLKSYELSLRGNVKDSVDQLQNIKSECTDISINVRAEALLANNYAIFGEYQKALTNLDNSLSRIDEVGDKNVKIYVYTTAYIVYDLVNQNKLSHDFAQIVIDLEPPSKQICKASVYKFISQIKLNLIDDGNEKISNVIKFCIKQNENSYAQALNVNWIDYLLKTSDTKEKTIGIYQYFLESNDSIMATQYKNLIVFKDSLMARILEELGEKEEAVRYAKQALEGTITLGNSQQKIDALKVLYNYYEDIGDYKQANTYLLEKNLTEIKYYSDKQEKLMAYQTIKHDSLAKLHQIKTLNQKNEVLMLEKELAVKSKANQLLLTYLFGSLVILLLYIGYRIRKQQKIYKSLSEMDYMTKIYNRKGMKDYMEYMLPYSEKKEEVIAFGIFDLDLFKKINDEYGHTVGDWVIKETVEACKKLNHEKATFARLGGEEFAIIMRDSSITDIQKFAEACREAIHNIDTHYETGHDFKISASFGITTTAISGHSLANLLKDADEALYFSKENGRNQVTVFKAKNN